MKPHTDSHAGPRDGYRCSKPTSGCRGFVKRWFIANSLVSGFFALCWLLLRSGAKPSRLAYPCQQAAISAAMLAFAAPLIAALIAVRRGVLRGLRTPRGVGLAGLGLLVSAGAWGYLVRADEYSGPVMTPRGGYRAAVYSVTECPQNSLGARFVGMDNLVSLMGREGLKFYQSATESPVAGPGGIIAADDVVAIKINYQWSQRGGTNIDALRGLVWSIVNHPDTFSGEVVICENTQFVTGAEVDGFDRTQNNAQDYDLSPHDVVVEFQGLGYSVSHYAWRTIRGTQVTEYDAGNMNDGYIVYGYDSALHGAVSYPKFQTDYDTYVSLKLGIWDPGNSTYDRNRLKFINMPVLKSHGGYQVTAAVKHHMGTVTGSLGTSSHSAIHYGVLGAMLAETQPADLNILDCIWVNDTPGTGPGSSYGSATRKDQLVASLDPVAADVWATTYVLGPAFGAENPNSTFRQYLDNSMNYILAAGDDATNDLDQIDAYTWNGDGDFDSDSDVDLADAAQFAQCYSGPGGGVGAGCDRGDFDDDGDVDCDDWAAFEAVWTGPGSVPPLPQCSGVIIPRPMADSAIDIAGTVRPCVTDEDCVVGLLSDSQMACIPAPFDGGGPATCYVKRNKYLSIDANPNSAGTDTARRVQLVTGETLGWVGPPLQVDVSGPEVSPQWLARVQDTAYYMDWTIVGTVHLGDCEIVPGTTYEIQAIVDGSDEADEAAYSQPLVLGTVTAFGDVVGSLAGSPPDGLRNFTDILAVVRGYRSEQTEPKVWLDLKGGTEAPEVPDFSDINFADIYATVAGFQGEPYPFAMPCECPGQTCP